mmetsp:Transcript_31225/g.96442  ORF Transcript_31225/g.96442 Transcript_31225/m.96442 type:complete len:229 (+) Transcript_31225:721-1407(+)
MVRRGGQRDGRLHVGRAGFNKPRGRANGRGRPLPRRAPQRPARVSGRAAPAKGVAGLDGRAVLRLRLRDAAGRGGGGGIRRPRHGLRAGLDGALRLARQALDDERGGPRGELSGEVQAVDRRRERVLVQRVARVCAYDFFKRRIQPRRAPAAGGAAPRVRLDGPRGPLPRQSARSGPGVRREPVSSRRAVARGLRRRGGPGVGRQTARGGRVAEQAPRAMMVLRPRPV